MADSILNSVSYILSSFWKNVWKILFRILIISIGYVEISGFLYGRSNIADSAKYLWLAVSIFPCIAIVLIEKEIFSIEDHIAPYKLYNLKASDLSIVITLFISKWILSLIPGCIYYCYLYIRGIDATSLYLLFIVFQFMALILSPFQYGIKSIIISILLAAIIFICKTLSLLPLIYLATGYLLLLYLLYLYSFKADRNHYLLKV